MSECCSACLSRVGLSSQCARELYSDNRASLFGTGARDFFCASAAEAPTTFRTLHKPLWGNLGDLAPLCARLDNGRMPKNISFEEVRPSFCLFSSALEVRKVKSALLPRKRCKNRKRGSKTLTTLLKVLRATKESVIGDENP